MAHNMQKNNINEVIVRFGAPTKLRDTLQELANERNITISALLRLIASEYVRRSKTV